MFGSTLASKVDITDSRPLSFSASSSLGAGPLDFGSDRTESVASDMSDEFFGFSSAKTTNAKPKPKEETFKSPSKLSESPPGDLFSSSKPKQGLFSDDTDIFGAQPKAPAKTETVPSKSKPAIDEGKVISPLDDGLFATPVPSKTKEAKATAETATEEGNVISPLDDGLFAAPVTSKTKALTKAASLLEEGDLFAVPSTKTESKAKTKAETKSAAKESTPASSEVVSPLDDDDLFGVSVKGDVKQKVEPTPDKKTVNPLGDTESGVKPPVDEDEALFNTHTTPQGTTTDAAKKTSASKSKPLLDVSRNFSFSKRIICKLVLLS